MSVFSELIALLQEIVSRFARIEQKIDEILKNVKPDFSQEDASVLGMQMIVKQAENQIPHPAEVAGTPPETKT